MKKLQGTFGEKIIESGATTAVEIAAQAVGTVLLSSVGEAGNVHCRVLEGAGVQVVVPELSPEITLRFEVAAGAQLTVSLPIVVQNNHAVHLSVALVGAGANVHVQLGAVVSGTAESKITCVLDHRAPRTLGRITARRILLGSAQSSFMSMLKVGVDAHITDTYLSDKVVLVGERAQASSDPQLEILADDVKASHGATIGQLSGEELFYLRSRGLAAEAARGLMLEAFLQPALIGVPLSLVNRVFHGVLARSST